MTLKCNFCGTSVQITEATDPSKDPYYELYQCPDCLSEGYLKDRGDELEWYGCVAKKDHRKHSKRPSTID